MEKASTLLRMEAVLILLVAMVCDACKDFVIVRNTQPDVVPESSGAEMFNFGGAELLAAQSASKTATPKASFT
jgi:hypothetical protein